MQPGDDPPEPFSRSDRARSPTPQIECAITRTTAATHAVIRENVHRSPMYSGQIKSRGPRYCPSIEDKIVRFGDRDGHQIFLEPEGLDDTTVYPNGISTSLPEEVQHAVVASIPGPGTRARSSGRAMRSNTTTSIRASCTPTLETKRVCRAVPGRADQRHDRLRGGRRAGPDCRPQCGARAGGGGAGRVRPGRRLPRRDGRRSGDARA